MNRIEFYKNNRKVDIIPEEIIYFKEDMKIQKETEEMIIILDFKNNRCQLITKPDNIRLEIPVISMNSNISGNEDTYEYVLETQPDIKNKIIIYEI